MMRRLSHWTQLGADDRGAAAALGNFDGVHLGHQAVISLAATRAAADNAPLGVITFEPHPRSYFAPDAPPFRLMNAQARAHRLEKIGVSHLYELPFDASLAAMTAEEFARDVLAQGLGISHVVIGADFRFGKGREGDAAMLAALGQSYGFACTIADLVGVGGTEVSSTQIRRALSEGRPRDAASMLGHLHRIEGNVEHGEKRGRALGYPTANLSITDLHPPLLGIYAVRIEVLSGAHKGQYDGAASIGTRPMFGNNIANCEAHLFDFDGDLYGTPISVALVEYLRPEKKFDGLAALITQMGQDCAQARDILKAQP